jgi:hypothetical protein
MVIAETSDSQTIEQEVGLRHAMDIGEPWGLETPAPKLGSGRAFQHHDLSLIWAHRPGITGSSCFSTTSPIDASPASPSSFSIVANSSLVLIGFDT